MEKIILASASPRRQELFRRLFENFEIVTADLDETPLDGEAPTDYCKRLAEQKALTVAKAHPDALVVGSDTIVVSNSKILGKPCNKQQAMEMLKMLSGVAHSVYTAVSVVKNGQAKGFTQETRVEFYPLSKKDIEEYVNSDEPYDKAGGYGIQGKAALFIKGIVGDYYNVVGLPLAALKVFLVDCLC